jgi:hypothetical protein
MEAIMKIDAALDRLFEHALSSEAVQEFAKNHPGKEMEINATVTVSVKGNPECVVVGEYPGYVLSSSADVAS